MGGQAIRGGGPGGQSSRSDGEDDNLDPTTPVQLQGLPIFVKQDFIVVESRSD